MIALVNDRPALLSCRWILFRKRADSFRSSSWTRALCGRLPDVPRMATEEDCRGCKFWEGADKRQN